MTASRVVVSREKAPYHDVASVISCFCIAQTCKDWFLSLSLPNKIEAVFIFRSLIYGVTDKDTAASLMTLLPTGNTSQALAIAEKIHASKNAIADKPPTNQWRWNLDEDMALFSALIYNTVNVFSATYGRTNRAIQRRVKYWIDVATQMLSLDTCEIRVDESLEEKIDAQTSGLPQDDDTGQKVVKQCGFEREDTCFDEDLLWKGGCSLSPRKTIGQRNVQAALAGREVKALKKQCIDLRMAGCRAKKEYYRANRELEKVRNDKNVLLEPLDSPASNLLRQLSQFAQMSGKSRRYPEEIKVFWMSVYAISPQCFEYISSALSGPCRTTMKLWTRTEKEILHEELTNLQSVTKIAARWVEKWGPNVSYFTLSYDACKLDEDLVIDHQGRVRGVLSPVKLDATPEEYKADPRHYQKLWEQQVVAKNLVTHSFVFMLNPISTQKGYPVHVVFSNSGSANDQVMRCITEIPMLLAKMGINIKFEASDSGNKYRMAFLSQFRGIYQQFSQIYMLREGSCDIRGLDGIDIPVISRCNDIPHILKRWRSRLVNHPKLFLTFQTEVCSDQGIPTWLVNVDVVRTLNPRIPNSAFRVGSMPAMDDTYPRMIFNIETMIAAWSQRHLDVVIFLLPAVCAEIVFRNDQISRAMRMEFAYLGWCTCIYYFAYLEDCSRMGRRFRFPVLSKDLLVDMSNALFCQLCAMSDISNEYRVSKVSSTISEHFFARMRRTMGPDQSCDTFTRILLRNVICDLLDHRTTEDLRIPRRSFDSATCEQGACHLNLEAAIEVRDFLSSLFALSSVNFSPHADHIATFSRANHHCLETSKVIASFVALRPACTPIIRFTIHAGQSRTRRIYGRAIISRFQTSAKPNPCADIAIEERLQTVSEDSQSSPS